MALPAPKTRFRVALSFAGEKRAYVSEVAAILAARFGREAILYDKYHEAEFSRRDLGIYLPDLYRNQSDLVVVVLCPNYSEKEWCGLEWHAIFDFFKNRLNQRVMLCRFGHAMAEGLYSIAGFVELDEKTPQEAAKLILQRLAINEKKTAAEPAATPSFHAASPRLSAPALLVDRDDELAALDAAWSGPEKKNIVTIVAWGGVGKTSLVSHWAARKLASRGHGGIDRYFDWSFYSQGSGDDKVASADVFIKTALEFFGDSRLASSSAGPWQKGERLAHLVSRPGTLLILDGLEPLQEAKTGQLRDEGLLALLRGLAVDNGGLCLVTTRQSIPDLALWNATTAPEQPLNRLSTAGGAELLEKLGVQGTAEEREELAKDVKGHALTLTLLGKYLVEAHGGDIRRRDLISLTDADEEETSGHAFRVIEAYERWLKKDRREVELAILSILGLFDRPATPDCLHALRAERDVTDAQWNVAVKRLVLLGLIEEQPWEPPRIFGYTEEEAEAGAQGKPHLWKNVSTSGTVLDAHPLIREYFGRRLRDADPSAWRSAHSVLFDHLAKSVPYWPEGLDGLQPLYQAVAHGCQAGRYDESYEVWSTRILRWQRYYSMHVLGVVGADLAGISSFFVAPWREVAQAVSDPLQASLLGEAALRLFGLGRLSEGRQPMQVGLARQIEWEQWDHAVVNATNLSELELTMGEITSAIEQARQAVAFADRGEEALGKVDARAVLAHALHQSGSKAEALAGFEEAENLQKEHQPIYPLLYSIRSFWYCDLLLANAETAAWRTSLHSNRQLPKLVQLDACAEVQERATTTLRIATQHKWLLDIALDRLTLARTFLYGKLLVDSKMPELSLDADEVVSAVRESGTFHHVPRALLTRSWYRALLGRTAEARADLAEAQLIAERGPMLLHLADVTSTARAFSSAMTSQPPERT